MKGDTEWANCLILYKPNLDFLYLELARLSDDGKIKRKLFKRKDAVEQIVKAMKTGIGKECSEVVALLVVQAAEPEMRQACRIARIDGVDNVKINIRQVKAYLNRAINGSLKGEDRIMTLSEINSLISSALGPLKHQLGYSDTMIPGYIYRVNQDVRDVVDDPGCLAYLDAHSVSPLRPDQFLAVCSEVKRRFPNHAGMVIEAIEETKQKEALSYLSMNNIQHEQVVSIASPECDHLQLEAWKLIQLVGAPNCPLKIHEFPAKWTPEVSKVMAFNHNKSGTVVAKLTSKSSRLYVACLETETGNVIDRSEFLLDINYLLCLWYVLQRLDQDAALHRAWLQMSATAVHIDPFIGLYTT